ncbi:sugar ABC transporter substrate-binding protein [Nordella sp. HKS 07]|uniref:ABC transporter substrate-binding protein n=1 Tax=Nordella sp. HKS 07 TaxID=2712222 RepID=UPI0013E123CF|nr:sugar ABC transporter substrate-binding protein [Nordella sp. HKS 07]QIG49987.1 sugar ABC transporter substrate-binding protein [Nordella sp. HKS 07]
MRKLLLTAAVLGLTATAPALAEEDAAAKAVEAAKQFGGSTITVVAEAGLQALLDTQHTGPEWEKLTGIKVKVVELPFEEIYPKTILEKQAGTGGYDVLLISPAWLADMVANGAAEPLDPYIEKYGVKSEFDDINPAFKDWMSYNGKIYGLVVDGDVLVTYYRKDLFADQQNQKAFKEKYGYDLAVPKSYKEFGDIACFLTEKYKPDMYGAGVINTGYTHFFFSERFRNYGGRFFDPETMKATVNSEAGLKALTEMVEQNKCMSPGIETWGFAENLSAMNAGEIAMTISWPPVGRWAQGINIDDKALSWVPKTTVADKVGYAINPGGHPQLASGFLSGVSPDSKNKDAAYLYAQWMHSKSQSLNNVMLPVGLRDPYRISHYESAQYQNLWPGAKDYLKVLKDGAASGYADISVIETFKYQDAISRAVNAAIGGEEPQAALDALAAEFDQITEAIGVDKQREAYKVWAAKPSAYRE